MADTISNLRTHSLFTSTISSQKNGETMLLGKPLEKFIAQHSFTWVVGSLWLGKEITSKKTEEVMDIIVRLGVDHGPYVSGAINTIIAARAGKDLVSALCSGLLTIGPRFGGATNAAAEVWFNSVQESKNPVAVVEEHAKAKKYIPGIGHKQYRIDIPDPRVRDLTKLYESGVYLDYARKIEAITTKKKPNLILNIDGAIAAIMLDILEKEEKLTNEQIAALLNAQFMDGLFILSRTVGFIAHYFDQRRLNEGLFRMPVEHIFTPEI
ncbi:MAG: hypothetical protein NUV65_06215 [Candidatus Roizmanbacteria bacterium]|nr:hypothetical protein [Candidatus Roizmanbacteria bacterium]